MKSQLITVNEGGCVYTALQFICPGCALFGGTGLHLLPVNSPNYSPSWDWDGNLEQPSLSPSIHTKRGEEGGNCHSFLKEGVFDFLSDCDHILAGTIVEMPDLPDWLLRDRER